MALVPPFGGDVAGAGPEPAAAPAGPPRNGLQAIKEDHQRIFDIFSQYKTLPADDRTGKLAACRKFVTAISQHASAEERTIYPMINAKVAHDDGQKLLYDMMVMDDQINKEHLNYLATHTPVTDSDWHLFELQLKKFMMVEEEHLKKEEREVIDRLDVLLSETEKDELYTQWERALHNAPLFPHPHVGGTTAIPAKLLHPLAGVVDRVGHAATGLLHKVMPGGTTAEHAAEHAGHTAGQH